MEEQKEDRLKKTIEWMLSDKGIAEIQAGHEEAMRLVERLREQQKMDLRELHKPITI